MASIARCSRSMAVLLSKLTARLVPSPAEPLVSLQSCGGGQKEIVRQREGTAHTLTNSSFTMLSFITRISS